MIDYRIGLRNGLWRQPSIATLSQGPILPAHHIVANLTAVFSDGTRGTQSTYLTILCQSDGNNSCVQKDALLTILSTMQTAGLKPSEQSTCSGNSVEALAATYGLTLLGDRGLSERWEKF